MNPSLILEGVAHAVTEGGSVKKTLAPLSRTFTSGQFHVVGGPSGSGKTTLLSILSLTVPAHSGVIHWGNVSLSAMSPMAQGQWRRKHLGLIFQTSRLVGVMSALEHVRLAAAIRGDSAAESQGRAVLQSLGMKDHFHSVPGQLSGGEKQRVAIAQALCSSPAILLADEPTAALDQQNAILVAQTLRNYAHKKDAIVICVSHDRAVLDAADNLLMLEKP